MATALHTTDCCIVSLTREGNDTAERIRDSVTVRGRLDCFTLEKYARPGFFTFTDTRAFFKNAFLEYDTLITVMATGIVVRMLAPSLDSKAVDPGVIVTDVYGKYFIPLLSGHLGRANENARILAVQTGGIPIITTASDNLNRPAVDTLASALGAAIGSLEAAKDVTAAIVDDKPIALIGFTEAQVDRLGLDSKQFTRLPYPADLFDADQQYSNLDALLPRLREEYAGVILLSDRERVVSFGLPAVQLIPKTTVIGVGCKRGIPGEVIVTQIKRLVQEINLSIKSIRALATIPLKQDEAGLLKAAEDLGAELIIVPEEDVAAIENRFPGSPFVKEQTGLTAVSEPCGYVASGHGECLLEAVREDGIVLSFWREREEVSPPQKIFVVGLGPGSPEMLTPQAREALRASDVIVGYKTYIDLIRNHPELKEKEFLATGMKSEKERAQSVLDLADNGKCVSLISSGDPGVYGMAGILLEVSDERDDLDIEILPGITAANAAAAKLGAPLMNDYCVVSLSDILTPWEQIEKRLRAAGEGDFVLVLYNPKSKSRTEQIQKAREILLEYRSPDTPVGIVTRAGRDGEEVILTTLEMLCENPINMFSTVIIGNSHSVFSSDNEKIITPRGYPL